MKRRNVDSKSTLSTTSSKVTSKSKTSSTNPPKSFYLKTCSTRQASCVRQLTSARNSWRSSVSTNWTSSVSPSSSSITKAISRSTKSGTSSIDSNSRTTFRRSAAPLSTNPQFSQRARLSRSSRNCSQSAPSSKTQKPRLLLKTSTLSTWSFRSW